MLIKVQYRCPREMTMNADCKFISQPSVDSENNERVTSERVGSSHFFMFFVLSLRFTINVRNAARKC